MELLESSLFKEDSSKMVVLKLGDHLGKHLELVKGRLVVLVVLKVREIGSLHFLDHLLDFVLG